VQRTLLILLVAVSYLLLAGGRPWTLGPLLGLAALAVLASPRRTLTFRPAWRLLDLALIFIVAAIVIQLIPLPSAVVQSLSPQAQRVRAALEFAPLTPQPEAWMTLSIDPAATARALATVLIGMVSFWVARALFGAGGHTRAFCRAIALIGAVMAVMALVQKSTAPKLLMFTVEPEARSTNPFGAFTNRNHMAAWLLLIAAPLVGYVIARVRINPDYRTRFLVSFRHFLVSGAALTALASIVIVVTLLATLSRSGVIALGVAAITACLLGRSRMQFERSSLAAVMGTVGVVVVVTMAFVDLDGWATRWQESFDTGSIEFSRMRIWQETLPVIRDFWLTGTGAGTYSEAMTQYQQSRVWVGSMQRWAHINNAHSHYLQVMSEGGLLLAIPALAALAAFVALAGKTIAADKGEMFWVRAGAAAGLAGLAVQSIWEVALTMPANAVLAGVLAGLVVYQRDGTRSSPVPTPELPTPRPLPARTHADRRP
jgi:putative inorganic carbon (HCO3(-)) transporter